MAAALFVIFVLPSIRIIGPTEVGLVTKRFAFRKLPDDNPIAFHGEAGYQADLLMPGWHLKLWMIYLVEKHPWVQVRAGEIGVVVAQVGRPLPIGAKSAESVGDLSQIADLRGWLAAGGQKGVQRPVLPPGSLMPVHPVGRLRAPGSLMPVHPVGFLVITRERVYGVPVAQEFQRLQAHGHLTCESFGLSEENLKVTVITPRSAEQRRSDRHLRHRHHVGRPAAAAGAIASRLGEFDDIKKLESENATDPMLIEALIGSKSVQHNNYQDFDAFLKAGGKMGLQHDPLLYGAYLLNPFLVRVEQVPMLVVKQGEVAVIKAYVGLPTQDTSGAAFKFGSIVRPGHRGIWQEPLRTGKYAINPRCYEAEKVPTAILSLNWSEAVSQAHKLDERLSQIVAKSREGFVFKIELVVQIHVPDTTAPRVISMVGTIANLVNEVLQAAVGNHFRDKLQSMPAVQFIETRQQVQQSGAGAHPRPADAIRGGNPRRIHPGRDPAGGAGPGAHATRNRQPGKGHLPDAAGGPAVADRHGKGQRHGRHAGPVGPGPGGRGDRRANGRRPQEAGRRRGHLHRRDGPGESGRGRGRGPGPRQGLRGPGPCAGSRPDGDHQRGHGVGRTRREDRCPKSWPSAAAHASTASAPR